MDESYIRRSVIFGEPYIRDSPSWCSHTIGGAMKSYVYHTLGEPPFTKKPNIVRGQNYFGEPHYRGIACNRFGYMRKKFLKFNKKHMIIYAENKRNQKYD